MTNLPTRIELPEISPVVLAQVARAVAQDISLLSTILKKHGLTEEQYEFLEKNNAYFKSTLEQETKNWQSIKSTEARLRLQAQAALESQMPTLATRMGSSSEKLGDAVEAAKLFARIAGVDAAQSGPASAGERFTINIDLGAGANVVIEAGNNSAESMPAVGASPLPKIIEGKAN
jgi:hypothetical protein